MSHLNAVTCTCPGDICLDQPEGTEVCPVCAAFTDPYTMCPGWFAASG